MTDILLNDSREREMEAQLHVCILAVSLRALTAVSEIMPDLT